LPLFQRLVKWLPKPRWRKAAPITATDPFGAAPDGPGLRLTLLGHKYLYIERISIFAILISAALYMVAAFLANEWLYLLSAGIVLSAMLASLFPLLIVSSVISNGLLPDYGAVCEGARIFIKISQSRWLGPLRYFLPLSCMRVRVVLARRTPGGYQAEQLVAQHAVCLENCGDSASVELYVPELARGVYKLSHLDVATCMPFGLAWAIGRVSITEDQTKSNMLVVMPQVMEMRGGFLEALHGLYTPVGMRFANVRAFSQSSSVRGLREFRTGDSLRHIHWPSSARLSRLLVREFDSETIPMYNLFIDLESRWLNRRQFELAVCVLYSLVHFGYDHDILPEVFVSPQIDSDEMDEFMFDLPQMKPPLDLLGEILARVEPLPASASKQKTNPSVRYQSLAIVPSKEVMLIAGGQSSPVNLVAVEPDSSIERGQLIATIYSEQDLKTL